MRAETANHVRKCSINQADVEATGCHERSERVCRSAVAIEITLHRAATSLSGQDFSQCTEASRTSRRDLFVEMRPFSIPLRFFEDA